MSQAGSVDSLGPVAGKFTDEQKEYLAGFMDAVARQGLVPYLGAKSNDPVAASPAEDAPAEETVFGTPRLRGRSF